MEKVRIAGVKTGRSVFVEDANFKIVLLYKYKQNDMYNKIVFNLDV